MRKSAGIFCWLLSYSLHIHSVSPLQAKQGSLFDGIMNVHDCKIYGLRYCLLLQPLLSARSIAPLYQYPKSNIFFSRCPVALLPSWIVDFTNHFIERWHSSGHQRNNILLRVTERKHSIQDNRHVALFTGWQRDNILIGVTEKEHSPQDKRGMKVSSV